MKLTSHILLLLLFPLAIYCQSQLPQATVKDIDGNKVDLTSYVKEGNPKLVSLWATWCGPCRMELSALKKVYPAWQEKYDLEIVAISLDKTRMIPSAKKMFEKNGWPFTFLYDDTDELMTALGIRGIPYSMLIDGKGNIVSTQMGFSSNYEKMMEEKLEKLN